MLINKWSVIEFLNNSKNKNGLAGFSLYLNGDPARLSDLLTLQELPENSFSVFISGEDRCWKQINRYYIEKIIGIFFQPCYYLADYQPLVFLANKTTHSLGFINALSEECNKQGFQIRIMEVKKEGYDATAPDFAYQPTSASFDYSLITKEWLSRCLENKNPGEIHLLVSHTEPNSSQILDGISALENAFIETEEYKIAHILYEKQKLINAYMHQLEQKIDSEKQVNFYLNIQKEQTSNQVRWYHYEYEILPGWYKKFGHIIKVFMGKRTLRSLFGDNVKKYKD
jgi:hypothetical protein